MGPSVLRRGLLRLGRGLLPLLMVLLMCGVPTGMMMGWRASATTVEAVRAQARVDLAVQRIRADDDALINAVRLATATGNGSPANRYEALTIELAEAVADIRELQPYFRYDVVPPADGRTAVAALERAALAQVAAGRPVAGRSLVTGQQYDAVHARYRVDTDEALAAVTAVARQHTATARSAHEFTFLRGSVMAGCVLSTALITAALWRRSRREQLRDGARTAAILDSATVSFVEMDRHGRIIASNRRAQQATGWTEAEARGQPLLDIVAPPGTVDRQRWAALIDAALAGDEAVEQELLTTLRNGDAVQTEVAMWPSTVGPGRVNVFVRDVTDRASLVAQLRQQALTDPLTGLPNRRALTEQLTHVADTGGPAALLYLDLDEFKVVNDAYGHSVGDLLLRTSASRIGDTLTEALGGAEPGAAPPGALCARLGGDEFAVLLTGDAQAHAEPLADRLIAALAQPMHLPDVPGAAIRVAASLGLARHTDRSDATCDLLADADLALYAAKAAGRNRWARYERTLRETAVQRATVEGELRAGLRRGELVPHFQPVVRTGDGAILGVEALARWQHPERGLLPPAAFIDVAENTDLIIEIGACMLAQTCAQLAAWDRELGSAAPAYAAVNLSARHLARQNLVADVTAALHRYGLPPHRLVLEITEAAIIEDTTVASRNLHALRDLGIRLAVDDFGTGHSSLARLGTLPVHILKIDRSFVMRLGDGGTPLVELTLGLAESLGLDVVAEGVETTVQRDHLEQLGCANAQGYLYARPTTADEITAICRDQSAVRGVWHAVRA